MRILVASLCLTMIAITPVVAQRDFSSVEVRTTKVADGLYMLEGAGGNIGLSIGEDGAFMIDDQYAPLSGKIVEAVKSLTDQDVKFVLNTHYHADHTGGNEAFGKAGAHIVAHDNVRKRLKEGAKRERGPDIPPTPADGLPVITFSTSMTFHWNGQEIRIWHPPAAHTDGDAVVFFPSLNAVHMGDVFFNGNYPFVDVDSGGNINGYIAALENVLSKIDDNTKIIPGHGPMAVKADLVSTLVMLKEVRSRVAAQIEQGLDEEAAVAADPLSDLNPQWGQWFINGERMVRAAYRSLQPAE